MEFNIPNLINKKQAILFEDSNVILKISQKDFSNVEGDRNQLEAAIQVTST
jgi:hypothetical protein